MDRDCNITSLSENISKAAQVLVRDLKRFRRILKRCPDCEGYYCPVLLEVNQRIELDLQEIDTAQSLSNEGR